MLEPRKMMLCERRLAIPLRLIEGGGIAIILMNGLRRDQIKYIAALTMTINHVAQILIEPLGLLYNLMIGIGYFTAPVMCYFLAEGYRHTHSKKAYATRLLAFAILSEYPFCWAFSSTTGKVEFCGFNMIFTLFLCFCCLWVNDHIQPKALAVLLQIYLVGISVFSDWPISAIIFTLLFDWAGEQQSKKFVSFLAGTFVFVACRILSGEDGLILPVVGITAAGLTILRGYNGEQRMSRLNQWFFYLYYPLHLLLLGLLRILW